MLRIVPDWALVGGELKEMPVIAVDASGNVTPDAGEGAVRRFSQKLLLPGFVNGHSHAFQRVLRGRTEFKRPGHPLDDFWSWRERMYQAAVTLSPEQLYSVSRQAFLEMALAGFTSVGEFHYVHHQADGSSYTDENLLAKVVISAAREVGLRVVLLRVGYARAGFQVPENPRQKRFIDNSVDQFLERVESLKSAVKDPMVSIGLAPHSVRAVPRSWLEAVSKATRLGPVHMHVSEQQAEIRASLHEWGKRPVELLSEVGLLSSRFTAVHAIHLEANEVQLLGQAGATVCACPSTERNLGDGVVRADELLKAGAQLSLGTDSQAHIDGLDEARQLEGHLRLIYQNRAVLFPTEALEPKESALGMVLQRALTDGGAKSLGLSPQRLLPGQPADFVTVDLNHPTLVGIPKDALLTAVMLCAPSAAVRDVYVGGRAIVEEGAHSLQEQSARDFEKVMESLV